MRKDKIQKKILIAGLTMKRGGIETFFLDMIKYLQTADNLDIELMIFGEICEYEYLLRQLNVKVYYVISRKENYIKYHSTMKNILRNTEYDIIWSNQSSATNIVVQKYAKKYTTAKVITHSHGTGFETDNKLVEFCLYFLHFLNQKKMVKLSDKLLACSEQAGKWLYGKKNLKKTIIIKNAIDTDRFQFNEDSRKRIRNQLGIDNNVLIGNVGRFSPVKNHPFLIEIFRNYKEFEPNAKLLLIGDGEELIKIKDIVAKKKLEKSVIFLGEVENTNDYYNAMDLFILPSLSEGFGIVLLEAQCNGVPCIYSEAVPEEVKVTDLCTVLSLSESAEFWAYKIKEVLKTQHLREKYYCYMKDEECDIKKLREKIMRIICEI